MGSIMDSFFNSEYFWAKWEKSKIEESHTTTETELPIG